MKRFLVADDHVTVRLGIRAILEARPGWEVAAEASDGREAVAAALEKEPDVAIVDYSMPFMTGIDVTRCIKEHLPATEVLVFTVHDTNDLALRAYQAGARAFLAKSEANRFLLAAVESLIIRKTFFHGVFSTELQTFASGRCDRSRMLTVREQQVVKLVADGYSNKGISAMLHLSIKTTETHRAAAMRKLDISSTAGLVRYAVRSNLMKP